MRRRAVAMPGRCNAGPSGRARRRACVASESPDADMRVRACAQCPQPSLAAGLPFAPLRVPSKTSTGWRRKATRRRGARASWRPRTAAQAPAQGGPPGPEGAAAAPAAPAPFPAFRRASLPMHSGGESLRAFSRPQSRRASTRFHGSVPPTQSSGRKWSTHMPRPGRGSRRSRGRGARRTPGRAGACTRRRRRRIRRRP